MSLHVLYSKTRGCVCAIVKCVVGSALCAESLRLWWVVVGLMFTVYGVGFRVVDVVSPARPCQNHDRGSQALCHGLFLIALFACPLRTERPPALLHTNTPLHLHDPRKNTGLDFQNSGLPFSFSTTQMLSERCRHNALRSGITSRVLLLSKVLIAPHLVEAQCRELLDSLCWVCLL